MKKITLIFLLFFITTIVGYSKNDINIDLHKIEVEKQNQKINEISRANEELVKKFENQLSSNDRILNSISSQIEATSFNLTIFGIIFGILAVGLGFYVTFIERKIIQLRDENKSLLNQTKQAKSEVEELNKLIQKDIYGLFLKIKREETTHLLDRLIKVPKDINNLFNELASRDLEDEDFQKIKDAYNKLKELKSHESYLDNYHILFFQHFLYKTMNDNSLHSEVLKNYETCVNCAFDNDILKSTNDFIRFIVKDSNIEKYNNEINIFSTAISKSEFKNFNELFVQIHELLSTDDNRVKYFNAITTKIRLSKEFKIKFGKIVQKNFTNSGENEKTFINEIEKLEKEIVDEDNEVKLKEEEKERIKAEREAKKGLNQNKK